jgi:hypothetical protein
MVFFTDRVKSLFFLFICVFPFPAILVLASAFLTFVLAWRTLASAIFLVLAAPFFILLFVCRAVVFTALLVLAAPFLADLYVLGAALGICLLYLVLLVPFDLQ